MSAILELHPSEKRLDSLHLGELGVDLAAETEKHIAECDHCTERMKLRSPSAFVGLDVARLVNRLNDSVPSSEPTPTPTPPWMQRMMIPLTACAALALLLILVTRDESVETQEITETVSTKGSQVTLKVYRDELGKGGIEKRSGDAFHDGDRIRFGIDTREMDPSYLMILSIEESGKRSVYYPRTESETGLAALGKFRNDGSLVGAIELDAYSGSEWLYLIACPTIFSQDDVVVEIPGKAPRLPSSCAWQSFEMAKK